VTEAWLPRQLSHGGAQRDTDPARRSGIRLSDEIREFNEVRASCLREEIAAHPARRRGFPVDEFAALCLLESGRDLAA
jgi:hypothetical protein